MGLPCKAPCSQEQFPCSCVGDILCEAWPVVLFQTINHAYMYDACSNNIYRIGDNSASVGAKDAPRRLVQSTQSPVKVVPAYAAAEARDMLEHGLHFLILCITKDCNLECKYCTSRGAGDMPEDVAIRAVRLLFNSRSEAKRSAVIAFYGGEPLLRFDMIETVVGFVEDSGQNAHCRFSVTTNGSLIDKNIAKFLSAHDFTVSVSYDGPLHDQYRTRRDGRGTSAEVLRGIDFLIDAYKDRFGDRVMIQSTLTGDCDLGEFCAVVSESPSTRRGAGWRINFARAGQSAKLRSRALYGFDEAFRLYLEGVRTRAYARQVVPARYVGARALIEPPLARLYLRGEGVRCESENSVHAQCLPGHARLFVDVDGYLYPCEKLAARSMGYCLGNVEKGLVWRDSYELFLDFHGASEKECSLCWALPICRVCLAWLDGVGRDAMQPAKKRACHDCRLSQQRALTTFCQVLEHDEEAFRHLDSAARFRTDV